MSLPGLFKMLDVAKRRVLAALFDKGEEDD